MPWRMADNKTTVFLTDMPAMLMFNVDDLTTNGKILPFKDDMRNPTIGATHVVKDVNSDDTLGLVTEMPDGITGSKTFATFYRL